MSSHSKLAERDSVPEVSVRSISSGRIEQLSADRMYVACGGIGTTRLVLGSLDHLDRPVELAESVQFVMPAVSRRPTADPRQERDFTLNQFNLVYDASGDGFDLCQIHFYPYNPVFESSMPTPLQHAAAKPLVTSALRRLSVGLGYVPSWASPGVKVTARSGADGGLPELTVDRTPSSGWPKMFAN